MGVPARRWSVFRARSCCEGGTPRADQLSPENDRTVYLAKIQYDRPKVYAVRLMTGVLVRSFWRASGSSSLDRETFTSGSSARTAWPLADALLVLGNGGLA